MNFQEAERAYQDLRAQYSAGKLSNTDFEAEVSKLKVQDVDGRWWQIGVQSGEWYVHDGQKWAKGKPPAPGAFVPAQPAAPPEAPVMAGAAAAGSTPSAGKPAGSGLKPRLFSAAPAGRGGGLPTPVLIGIIGVVALIGIGILVALFMFVTGQFKGTPTTTALATKPAATVPIAVGSPVLPTLPAPLATNTPLVLSTLAVLPPTPVITATTAPVINPVTNTVAPRAATATRRPVTPTATTAAVKASPTANVPPGVYVTKVRTDPAKVNPGDSVTFYVTYLNTQSAPGPSSWLVKVYRCESACTGDELSRSIGETPRSTANISAGTKELAAGPWLAGIGSCNLVASPFYYDEPTGQLLPFPTTSGDRMYYNFKACP